MGASSFTLESALARKAAAIEILKSKARGIPVVYGKDGWLIQEAPDGTKTKIKKIKRNALYEQ
ncbi:hypothetical protein [Selenomonas sp.]|uniref:hypothetical protein n=1 Tax=Selenomonas sp. TaxID=2053611 RepID=UPI0025F5E3C7|nr:hypothetical protein [Selenomonas sp.]MCI6085887.1 hypothetical protein [Selenomonas sp.]MCI6284324.1 hypothetical protein [Selenomonas sp.]